MRLLLDANLLISLCDLDHVDHQRATIWSQQNMKLFATCAITQGALIRHIMRAKEGATVLQAKGILKQVVSMPGHIFWSDAVSYMDLPEKGVVGYRQVTDAYLIALAAHHTGRVATFDRALAALHSPIAILVG